MATSRKDIIKQLATKTITTLKTQLQTLSTRNAPKEEAEKATLKCFSDAFNEIKEEDRNQLYRQLSLIVHPDKVKDNFKEFLSYLERNDLLDTPQKMLGRFQKKNSLVDEINAPMDRLMRIFYCFQKIKLFQENMKIQPHYEPQFKKAIDDEIEKIYKIAPITKALFLFNNLK